ncbi:HNH endonuclease signature motif containing protein [Arthrobacter sp. C152]
MEGVRASVAALDALFLEEAALASGDPAGTGTDGHGAWVDVLQRQYEIRLERLELVSRLEGQLAAAKAQDAADCIRIQQAMAPPEASVPERTYTEMSAVEEIAGVLTISSAAAGAFVHQAQQVCSLPPVMDALAGGAVSWQHAKVIVDETEGLSPAGAASLVAHFFDPTAPNPARGAAPGDLVPSRFRAKARTWRERHHPESIEERHTKSAADRRMEYRPDKDGMAWISLHLPGDTASAIWNRTTAIARGLQGPDEPRTLTQLRPDIAASVLLGAGTTSAGTTSSGDTSSGTISAGGTGSGDGSSPHPGTTALGQVPVPKADVLVMVPVFSALGVTDEPAILDGYGPIPASMARKLLADGADSFHRVLVDPADGAPLEIGRRSYRLPAAIKRWIRMRDRKCTFPGCSNRTADNDTDHLQAWQHGGTTGVSNLGQLCPKHHRLKHNSGWTPTPATINKPPGWTSPTGRHYPAEQHDPEPPHWPPGALQSGALRTGLAAEVPFWFDPPPEEPPGENLLDPDDLCAADPLWDDFYALAFCLPPDPWKHSNLSPL